MRAVREGSGGWGESRGAGLPPGEGASRRMCNADGVAIRGWVTRWEEESATRARRRRRDTRAPREFSPARATAAGSAAAGWDQRETAGIPAHAAGAPPAAW
jgi:hypothetical protein